jgi:surfeit locus 1 family protein
VIVQKKRPFVFDPPLWGLVLLIPLLGIAGSAGVWQLGRAEEKKQLFQFFDDNRETTALTSLVTATQVAEQRYRFVRLTGRYDPEHQILLDNMMYQGKAGYQVLTPFRINKNAVLVNRGWVPGSPDRTVLPTITVDSEQRQILARIDLLPRPGWKLRASAVDTATPWPRRLLFPTAEELTSQIGYHVQNYQLLLDPEGTDGYQRDWRPGVMGPERHVGYAVQWFAIAVALIVIYIAVNLKRYEEANDDG